MENKFTLYTIINDNGSKSHFLLRFDTTANLLYVYHLVGLLSDNTAENKKKLKDIFKQAPDNTISISSTALIKFVDALGGITISGKKIDGKAALEEVKNDHFDAVLDGIGKKISSNKSFVFKIPGLFNSLRGTYETDLNVMDVIKKTIEEAPDFRDWKAELIKVTKDNVDSI